jgi:hypothetical protein
MVVVAERRRKRTTMELVVVVDIFGGERVADVWDPRAGWGGQPSLRRKMGWPATP